jgi:hypothetical protein
MDKKCEEICRRIRQDDEDLVEIQLSCEAADGSGGLTDRHVENLAGALQANHHVRALILWGNRNVTSIAPLLKALDDNHTLERVDIELTDVSAQEKDLLSRKLIDRKLAWLRSDDPHVRDITSLDLSRLGLSDKDIKDLASILRGNSTLTALSLWGNKEVTDTGGSLIADLLSSGPVPLVSISMDGTGVSSSVRTRIDDVVNAARLQKCINIMTANEKTAKTINLSNTGLDKKALDAIARALRNNSTATSLSLVGNARLTDADVGSFLDLLSEKERGDSLMHIAVDSESFDKAILKRLHAWRVDAVCRLLERNHVNATAVDLSRCSVTDAQFARVISAAEHSTHVASINVSRNKRVTDESASALLQLVGTHVSLARVNLTASGMSATAQANIARELKNRNLERVCYTLDPSAKRAEDLDLASRGIRAGATAGTAHAHAHTNSTRARSGAALKIDVLRGVGLDDDDAIKLAACIKRSTVLAELDLSGNRTLTDRCLACLCCISTSFSDGP